MEECLCLEHFLLSYDCGVLPCDGVKCGRTGGLELFGCVFKAYINVIHVTIVHCRLMKALLQCIKPFPNF